VKPVSSWGRLDHHLHDIVGLADRGQAAGQVQANRPGLAFGMGRSYGDICLNPGGKLWQTRRLDRFISFEQASGTLVCEAGVLLRDIQHLMMPRGWMLPVTPGTQLITVGGAIANDIHGKNHHLRGCFGDHVRKLTLLRTDGDIIECGPELRPEWFAATVGGMGLTGLIVAAELALVPCAGPWLDTETLPYKELKRFFALADGSEANWEHTVSWIDCLNPAGRGIFQRANPATQAGAAIRAPSARTFPFVPPVSLINKLSLRPLNAAYFHLNKRRAGRAVMHTESFSYPLDKLLHWNRLYGPHGFYQYQCVVPSAVGAEAIAALLARMARVGEGSCLSVLKTFGQRDSIGMMSFARPGVTLALDFPNRGAATLQLLDALDQIVGDAGGRLYAAKDARMPRALFEAGYPRLNEFLTYRDAGISSAMSRRLMGY
jgi:FAD/FMN-containing dehydrogenase